jgi:hypothetical protein
MCAFCNLQIWFSLNNRKNCRVNELGPTSGTMVRLGFKPTAPARDSIREQRSGHCTVSPPVLLLPTCGPDFTPPSLSPPPIKVRHQPKFPPFTVSLPNSEVRHYPLFVIPDFKTQTEHS